MARVRRRVKTMSGKQQKCFCSNGVKWTELEEGLRLGLPTPPGQVSQVGLFSLGQLGRVSLVKLVGLSQLGQVRLDKLGKVRLDQISQVMLD